MKAILKNADFILYLFVGPFAVLYIFPQFFLHLEKSILGINEVPKAIQKIGSLVAYSGAALAIWCTLTMWFSQRSSPNLFSKPRQVICTGPYNLVRHPMMWALFITLFGEAIMFLSPALVLWLLLWIRISILYVARYEEPYLLSVLGDAYRIYCARTPRWIPRKRNT